MFPSIAEASNFDEFLAIELFVKCAYLDNMKIRSSYLVKKALV